MVGELGVGEGGRVTLVEVRQAQSLQAPTVLEVRVDRPLGGGAPVLLAEAVVLLISLGYERVVFT